MPPSAASCVSCGRTFAENRELAAIPDAGRIAFDPTHRRVWRICASCGEWNLLGVDATAAALPEVEARFTAAIPNGAPELGFAPARVSSRLEILRVGQVDLIEHGDSSAVRLRNEVDHRTRGMRRLIAVMLVLLIAWCAFTLWVSHGSLSFVPGLLLLYSSTSLIEHVVSRILRTKVSVLPSFALNSGVLVAALGLVFAAHQQDHLRYFLVSLLATAPLIVVFDVSRSRFASVRLRLSDGMILRLSETDKSLVTISWTSGETDVSLHDLPKGRSLTGPDVAMVFRKVYPWSLRRGLVHLAVTMNAITENAYNLLSTLGGLAGLLRALEGYRRDNDSRVLIARLPVIYLVALDLALSEHTNRAAAGDDLRQRALDASEIAREAEALDRNGDTTSGRPDGTDRTHHHARL